MLPAFCTLKPRRTFYYNTRPTSEEVAIVRELNRATVFDNFVISTKAVFRLRRHVIIAKRNNK